jgi:hypothetical protein
MTRETLRQSLDAVASGLCKALDTDWRTVGSMTEAVSKQMNKFRGALGELLEAIR